MAAMIKQAWNTVNFAEQTGNIGISADLVALVEELRTPDLGPLG